MLNFNTKNGKIEKIIVDMLIDILAQNIQINHKLDSIHDFDVSDEDTSEYRISVLEYLQDKYGEISPDMQDFLKSKGINPNDKS